MSRLQIQDQLQNFDKKMKRQLMDEDSFKRIISNQNLIIQDLDKSYNSMCSFLQISSKYLPEAVNNFSVGQQHIGKIRNNLDAIHKIMMKIKKKIKKQKQDAQKQKQNIEKQQLKQEKKSIEEINNVTQAMKGIIEEEMRQNFEPKQINQQQKNTTKQQDMSENIQNQLQQDQIDKLLSYYKMDDTSQQLPQQKQIQNLSPTTKIIEQAFVLKKSPIRQIQNKIKIDDQPLI